MDGTYISILAVFWQVGYNVFMYEKLRRLCEDMVSPIEIQGLRGRMLVHPARGNAAKRNIVFVYGIHGSLERFYGIIHFLARFGRVTVPDLPGFGGMEPFYSIGKRPSLDANADYLAKFIEKNVGSEPLTLIGLSYGLVVITRLLERHPELQSRVALAVSVMGLADGRDIKLRGMKRFAPEALFWIGRTRPLDRILQYMTVRPWVLRSMYRPQHPKMQALSAEERPEFIAYESYLWQCNHMRTYSVCMHELFGLRATSAQIAVPVHHISTTRDHWLDIVSAERHLRQMYATVNLHNSTLSNHGGTAYAEEEEARAMIPGSVVKLLEQPS